MNRKIQWMIIFILILALITPVLAQVSTHFDLGWHIMSGGGGSRGSEHYQVEDVLGQWADGPSASDEFMIQPGFWPGGGEGERWQQFMPASFAGDL